MHLYLYVTADEYELPLAVAGTAEELAEMIGVLPDSVYRGVWKHKKHMASQYRIVSVPFDRELKELAPPPRPRRRPKPYMRREPNGNWSVFPSVLALAAAEYVSEEAIRKRMHDDRAAGRPPRYKPMEAENDDKRC